LKKVGFIGLGDMGMAMALNLLTAGFKVRGYDLRDERLKLLEEAGGEAAASPGDAGCGADTVFIMVMTGSQASDVINAPDGLLSTMAKGSTIIPYRDD
jgi:3-hydroxyisobutyrate dehydrogenase-like beta-hydroxyacid dehydrogenase